MRSNILLASALAMGVLAKPIDKRYYVTQVDEVIVTKTVYVEPGQATPAAEGAAINHPHPHFSHAPQPVVSAPAAPSTSAYAPPPAPSSKAAEVAPSPVAAPSANAGSHKSGPIQATFSSGPDYEAALVYHHNAVRANHNAGSVSWDDDCAKNALWSANQCQFKHQFPEGANNGQNIFTTSGDSFNVTAAVHESWYKGEFEAMKSMYGIADLTSDMSQFEKVGHLTALVWTTTTKFGCASVNCNGRMNFPDDPTGGDRDMGMFTVCNYASEVGNMAGEFNTHVNKPNSYTDLGSWSD